MIFSRRAFLKSLLAAGAAVTLNGCSPTSLKATPRVREVTQIVEVTVEVVKVITPEPAATKDKDAMIWYVDIEHENAIKDPKLAPNFDEVRKQRTRIVGEAAGLRSESIFYWEVSQELARQKKVKAIVISGNTSDWIKYDFSTFQPLFDLVKSGTMPTIGLCGGHQLIGLMYAGKCDAIRKLKPGEADPAPQADWAPGYFKEVGYMPVHVVASDPLFDGLGSAPVFFESHYWEIKELPSEFKLLASTENVRVQCLKHQKYPIYGTQFHPEVNDMDHRDGIKLLRNFFKVTGVS
jgi:GMP synthase-like glutamine amidotransferase